MRKIFCILSCLLVAGCTSFDRNPYDGALRELRVTAVYPEGYAGYLREGVAVKLSDRNTGNVYTALTDAQGERFIYLWGAAGVGKTHLLQQWVEHANAVGRAAIYLDARAEKLPDFAREARCVAVDHVDELEPDDQITLFSIFNSLRDSDGQLLTAGREPPQRLKLRDAFALRHVQLPGPQLAYSGS